MTWTCEACTFTENSSDVNDCIACGTPRPISKIQRQFSSQPSTEIFELGAKQKLGVKLLPPKSGVISYGINVDNVVNPLLENRIHPGDLIVAIGGNQLDGMGFSEAIDLIRQLPRPLEISFEIVESRRKAAKVKATEDMWDIESKLTTYAVVFDHGSMGLNLEEAVRYGIDGAVVKALKGQAHDSGMISIGDIVAKVNDIDVLFMPYSDVMNTIRNTDAPRTVQFVPKDKLSDIQRINSRQSEVIRPRDSVAASRFAQSTRIVRDDGGHDDSTSITDLIIQNRSATIKKGRMYKQGRLVKNWKARYFVLSVTKLEYFKSPTSTSSQGELNFIQNRCTVRDLPPQTDIVSKTPQVVAKYLLELRVADRKLIMACSSESEKKAWMDALKLAIDASKTVNRTNSLSQSLREADARRGDRSLSMNDNQNADGPSGGRFSEFDQSAFPTPIIHVTVLSASNLTKKGSSVNGCCEISLESEAFKTSIVKNQRNPVWKQDNAAAFEVRSEDSVLEIRIFDEHVFRATELISTLTVPIKSLPNMQKTIKKYPLVLSNRSPGAQLTLSLEYINKAKAFQQEQERLRLGDDLARASVMMERDEMLKIQSEAQAAADEAAQSAKKAEEEAKALLDEARRKAEAAVSAAREEAEQGKAAVELAMAEAARAKEEAEHQAKEARRAQEEAQALIEANNVVQKSAQEQLEGQQLADRFIMYRRMLLDNTPQEKVREKMQEDSVDEANIIAFFEGITSYDLKIKELQAQVAKLSSRKQEKRPNDLEASLANGAISVDQEKLLRRLLKLEKQLQQAGITIAEDIPYEEAQAQVEKISKRMQEIGSSDVTHPDPQIQKQLREEYYKLEQDMEKYNTALMVSDEYAVEQERKEREWEESNKAENLKALYAIRRSMPVEVKTMSESQLQSLKTPNGGRMPQDIARKFKRTNVLELLRMNPQDITRQHPSVLESLRVTGLTLNERRALHMHLKDIAESWKEKQKEELSGRKWIFFKGLLGAFKPLVDSYNRHVEQYGPPGNHPYATRDDPDNGCPLIGRQCPLKANALPTYIDLGFPEGDEYAASKIQKSDAEDAGAKALREARELAKNKLASVRADTLKKHYKGNVREAAKANGVCEDIDNTLDRLEQTQANWVETRIKSSGSDTRRKELTEFNEMIKACRLTCITAAERSGMNLSGKRNPANDGPDTRSSIEVYLCEVLIESIAECLTGIEERMVALGIKEKRTTSAISILRQLMQDIYEKNSVLIKALNAKRPTNFRKRKTLAEIVKEVQEKLSQSAEPEKKLSDENGTSGRGRGGRGRGPPSLLNAIRGRGRGPGRGPGRGNLDLMAAIAQRKKS